MLGDVVISGFQGTEVGGFFPPVAELKLELELRNLEIAGQWFSSFIIGEGIEVTAERFKQHCQFLKEVKATTAVVSEQTYSIQGKRDTGVFENKPVLTDAEWDSFCQGLNQLGNIAKSYGLRLGYHHHMGTVVQTTTEVDRLMAGTDPEKVGLLYDTGHIYVSDGEYLPLLEKHMSRIVHVHFKDVRKEALATCRSGNKPFLDSFLAGMFTVPGDGDIDFVPCYDKLIAADYTGWIVIEAEQDPTKAHPLKYALIARKYIDSQLLGR